MKTVKCDFNGNIVNCKVIENMGYQGGVYVMAVEYEGEEKIVQSYSGRIYKLRSINKRLNNQ